MQNDKKKILIYLFLILGIIIGSLLLAYILYAMIKMKGNYAITIAMFTDKFFIYSFLLTLIILFGALLVIAFKTKMFSSSKLIEKTDRVDSNLYDNQSFMTQKELKQKFGIYDITKLEQIEAEEHKEIYGAVINSFIDKKKLYASFVKDKHIVNIGTTGTGKSTYQAGPMLQFNARTKTKPSFVINDISGELYRKHSFFLQQQGYDVHLINLSVPREGERYNPLSIIWDLYHKFQESLLANDADYELIDRCSTYIEDISLIICPDPRAGEKVWTQGARGILAGCIWAMLEDSLLPELGVTKDMFNIAQISNIINRQKAELEKFLFVGRDASSKVFDCAGIIHNNRNEKGVDSYIGSLATALSLFKESGIQYLTSHTDINFFDITDKPTAIFVLVPTEDATKNLICGILYTQIYNMQVLTARKLPEGKLIRPLYFLLDEFGNLPKLENFKIWIATCRKMRIFFYIMLQSLQQLDGLYTKQDAENILNQCQIMIYLGVTQIADIKPIQEKLGTYTAKIRSESIDTSKSLNNFHGNNSLVRKDLVTISELQRMQEGTAYVMMFGHKPLKATFVSDFNKTAIEQNWFVKTQTPFPEKDKTPYNLNYYDLELRNSFFIKEEDTLDDFLSDLNEAITKQTQTKKSNTDNVLNLINK